MWGAGGGLRFALLWCGGGGLSQLDGIDYLEGRSGGGRGRRRGKGRREGRGGGLDLTFFILDL